MTIKFKRETSASQTYYNTQNTYQSARYVILVDGNPIGKIISSDTSAFEPKRWEACDSNSKPIIRKDFKTLSAAKEAVTKMLEG